VDQQVLVVQAGVVVVVVPVVVGLVEQLTQVVGVVAPQEASTIQALAVQE
jgi:hypothetical protein